MIVPPAYVYVVWDLSGFSIRRLTVVGSVATLLTAKAQLNVGALFRLNSVADIYPTVAVAVAVKVRDAVAEWPDEPTVAVAV